MLVMSRKSGETVVIGDPASPIGRVKVTQIMGDRVRLGFEFPRATPVHREEVGEKIVADAAAGADGATSAAGTGGAEAVKNRPPRPVVEILPRPGTQDLPRHRRLDKAAVEALAWFAGNRRPLRVKELSRAARANGFALATAKRLVRWGLVAVEAGEVLRITASGEEAVEAYARWAEVAQATA